MELHNVSDIHIKFTNVSEEKVKSKFSISRIKDYELSLIRLVANAFGCKVLWSKSNSYSNDIYGTYLLIGLSNQVKLAGYTCEVLQRKLVKAKNNFVSSLPTYSRSTKIIEGDGFCHGWVEAIKETVIEFAQPEETQKLIRDYMDEKFGKMKSGKAQQRRSGQMGFNNGIIAAAGESIQRPINEQSRLHLGN